MLPQAVADEVKRLLVEEGMSQRAVARKLGVSRGTVAAIAHNRRPNYELLRKERELDDWQPEGPPSRCPGCGGMVYQPCRLCYVRSFSQRRQRDRTPPSSPRQHRLAG